MATKLLVSVRSADEAQLAIDADVDLIDVKEPNEGSLGAASEQTLHEIATVVGSRKLLSASCGELINWSPVQDFNVFNSYNFAKIGLHGCCDWCQWRPRWLEWRNSLPVTTQPVLAIYVDSDAADSPSIFTLIDFAKQENVGNILFDTFDKTGPGLCEIFKADELSEIVQSLKKHGHKICKFDYST
jgi:(5-formylfuran-3-yl)methyl phosphate synthase